MKKNPQLTIQGRDIGLDFPPLVVAEIGINHEGSLKKAKQMIDDAKTSGAECVKFQSHIVEDEMISAAKKVIPGHTNESIYEIMASCSLNETEEIELQRYCNRKGIIFISTPFSRAAANRLKRMDVPAYKIGSGECNNYPLLKHIASFGKPIILSTGMNTIDSIRKAVRIFTEHNIPFALLHTTNVYPTPPDIVRLGALTEIQNEFPNAVVGLSDHTISNHACFGAVALGASILERHFTDSMERIGPDIICSMDENECFSLIQGSRLLKQMRGGKKGPVKEEQPTINFAYATVVTIKPIRVGEFFTENNIWVKRPGTGEIRAEYFEDLLGKKAINNIPNDTFVSWNDVNK